MLQLLTAQCKKLSCTTVLVKTLSHGSELLNIPNTTPEQVRKGTLEIVNDALDCPDVNVNALDRKGRSPLKNAAFRGDLAVVNRLLEMKGIDVNYVGGAKPAGPSDWDGGIDSDPRVTGRNALMEALVSPYHERRRIGTTTTRTKTVTPPLIWPFVYRMTPTPSSAACIWRQGVGISSGLAARDLNSRIG